MKLGHQGKCQKVITSQKGVVLPILFSVINILRAFNQIIFLDLLYHIGCDSLALFWNMFFCFVNSYLYLKYPDIAIDFEKPWFRGNLHWDCGKLTIPKEWEHYFKIQPENHRQYGKKHLRILLFDWMIWECLSWKIELKRLYLFWS